MIPGLWGAPVNLLSGIAPPNEYTEGSWSNASGGASSGGTHGNGKKKKYDELFKSKSPFGLDCYYDYYEALAEARRVKKPLLIDFTGHSCTNCRLMENKVWAVPDVLRKLREDVVIVSLYMDDKTELDSSEKYVSDLSHSKITTLGQMWNDFAGTSFNTNAEPYYVLFDQHEELLGEPTGYNSDVDKFSKLLDDAKIELKKR